MWLGARWSMKLTNIIYIGMVIDGTEDWYNCRGFCLVFNERCNVGEFDFRFSSILKCTNGWRTVVYICTTTRDPYCKYRYRLPAAWLGIAELQVVTMVSTSFSPICSSILISMSRSWLASLPRRSNAEHQLVAFGEIHGAACMYRTSCTTNSIEGRKMFETPRVRYLCTHCSRSLHHRNQKPKAGIISGGKATIICEAGQALPRNRDFNRTSSVLRTESNFYSDFTRPPQININIETRLRCNSGEKSNVYGAYMQNQEQIFNIYRIHQAALDRDQQKWKTLEIWRMNKYIIPVPTGRCMKHRQKPSRNLLLFSNLLTSSIRFCSGTVWSFQGYESVLILLTLNSSEVRLTLYYYITYLDIVWLHSPST